MKNKYKLCIVIMLLLSAVGFVVWPLVYAGKFQQPTIYSCLDSDRQWQPSNPAMSTCIGYGSAKIADLNFFCERRLTNTMIIGSPKCGTHALVFFLSQHPQVVQNTDIYEYNFFNSNEYYRKGVEWYRDRMPCSLPGQVVIECSPLYFGCKVAPKRIFDFDPNVKLILSVRNPVDRAVSRYTMFKSFHDKQKGTVRGVKAGEPFPPFELVWKNYSDQFYDIYFENWLEYFKLEQIRIVDGDAFRKSPLQELKKIEDFLNIDPYFQEKHFYLNKTKGMFCFRNPRFSQNGCLPKGKGRKHTKVNETVLEMIQDVSRPHNQRFYKLSKKQFSWENTTSMR